MKQTVAATHTVHFDGTSMVDLCCSIIRLIFVFRIFQEGIFVDNGLSFSQVERRYVGMSVSIVS